MKIALAQTNPHIGDFELNTTKIIERIQEARLQGVELIIFPELSLCGYPPRDFLEFDDFIEKCEQSALRIAKECVNISALVGMPTRNDNPKGKPLYNSAVLLQNGKIKDIFNKSLLPNYDIFDEYRYFEPNRSFSILNLNGKRIAVTICEDLWNIGEESLYPSDPMDELIRFSPAFMVNIAASPFNYKQNEIRKEILRRNVQKYNLPLVYVNQVGAQTEVLFDGGSQVVNNTGECVLEMAYFKEDFQIIETDNLSSPIKSKLTEDIELIHDALVMGIRDYFQKMGFSKAILGLSGGIDSAVVFALAAEALGSENVWGILLPSGFSSDHSILDAEALANNLGAKHNIISIEKAVETFGQTLEPHFKDLPFGLAEENLQARIRAVILMALSNKFGYILLNTSNKSEAAVGYGTLYGDMCGGISVLGDVYKTQVYELAHYINRKREIIPVNTITKAPSAELRPNQKDSDSLPDYDILDKILYQYIELRQGPADLIKMGFDANIVKKTLHLVNMNEYKRYQSPPILRVSPKAFGSGRRMPIVAKYLAV